MDPNPSNDAWLEAPGVRVPVSGTCTIGRAKSNRFPLDDVKVSRRHALVHEQGAHEFWLVDFGSVNGTYLNGRRLAQPVVLKDHDEIQIAEHRFTFRRRGSKANGRRTTASSRMTAPAAPKIGDCWLLVADIEASVRLSQTLASDQLPIVLGRWFGRCREIIDETGGAINQFLGDGFFAYWSANDLAPKNVASAIARLREIQVQGEPRFRAVMHYGKVAFGGVRSSGEESLVGKEVNFVFRMEKLASALRIPCLISEPASRELAPHFPTVKAGHYPLPGFDGSFPLFKC